MNQGLADGKWGFFRPGDRTVRLDEKEAAIVDKIRVLRAEPGLAA